MKSPTPNEKRRRRIGVIGPATTPLLLVAASRTLLADDFVGVVTLWTIWSFSVLLVALERIAPRALQRLAVWLRAAEDQRVWLIGFVGIGMLVAALLSDDPTTLATAGSTLVVFTCVAAVRDTRRKRHDRDRAATQT